MCGKCTDVLIETPVDFRKNYICGCGQLCEKCADILKQENSNLYTYENIEMGILLAELHKGSKGD